MDAVKQEILKTSNGKTRVKEYICDVSSIETVALITQQIKVFFIFLFMYFYLFIQVFLFFLLGCEGFILFYFILFYFIFVFLAQFFL